jgi:glycolate dehydrogenase iron-sulfur subunit
VFNARLTTGGALRPFLPAALGRKIPKQGARPKARPAPRHPRTMLMLQGCVQPALSPNTNAAAVCLLDRLGIGIVNAAQAGGCGASPLTAHARCSMHRSQAARSSRACSGSA